MARLPWLAALLTLPVLALLTALLTSLAVLAALLPVLIRIVCHLYSFIVAEGELTRRCGIMFGILY